MKYVIFSSYGNDSVALIQWAYESGLDEVSVVYSDTGWAVDWWSTRVKAAETWVRSLGFAPVRTESEGMERLIFRKKAWPRGGGGKFQFCTSALKQQPALAWLSAMDPDGEAVCMVGIRREESRHRQSAPEWIEESSDHGNRQLHAPLVRHREADRNALLAKTPFLPLPHRSRECFPCVNANQGDLVVLSAERVEQIRQLEIRMGINSKGNPRVMFSPRRAQGAIGIDAVIAWAKRGRGILDSPDCDSGWCGG